MSPHPYRQSLKNDNILRDHFALDRTILANERTLLAYFRTALAFIITGIGFLKFFQDILMEVLGWIFCACSMVTISIGFKRYRSFAAIYKIMKKSNAE